MRDDNLEELNDVLREIEYESYNRKDSEKQKVGIYLVIDDPTLDQPVVSVRNVEPKSVASGYAETQGKQFIDRDTVKAFGEWRDRVDRE